MKFLFPFWTKKKKEGSVQQIAVEVLNALREMKEGYDQQNKNLLKSIPDANDLRNKEIYEEFGKELGQSLADQNLGIRAIKNDFEAYYEYIDLKDQQQRDFISNIDTIKNFIKSEIEKLQNDGELERIKNQINEINNEIKNEEEKLKEDHATNQTKKLNEIEQKYINHLDQILNEQISDNSLKKLEYIREFVQQSKETLLNRLQENIEKANAETDESSTITEEVKSPQLEDSSEKKLDSIILQVGEQLKQISKTEQELLEEEKKNIENRKVYYRQLIEATKENYEFLFNDLKVQKEEKKQNGIIVVSRFQLIVTLISLLLMLIGEVAIVSSTLRITLRLSLPDNTNGSISSLQFFWNYSFIFSYTLAFSLAIKYFFSSIIKVARYKYKKPNSGINISISEIEIFEKIEIKRNKKRLWFSGIICFIAILGLVAIEPINMFELIKSPQLSDALQGTYEQANQKGYGFLYWLNNTFKYFGLIIFLTCITILYGGVGGMLYYDFFEMYEKFKNSGRTLWSFGFISPRPVRVLSKKLEKLHRQEKQREDQLNTLKNALLEAERLAVFFTDKNYSQIKRMFESSQRGMEAYFAMGYEKGKKITEEKINQGEDQGFRYYDNLKLFEAIASKIRKYQPWESIFTKHNSNGNTIS